MCSWKITQRKMYRGWHTTTESLCMIFFHLIGTFNCDVFEHCALERKVGQTSKEGGLLRTEACAIAEVQPTHKILFVHQTLTPLC